MAPRLKDQYNNEIRDKLFEELALDSVMQVPRMSKIVVNMGAGDAAADSKLINGVVEDLRIITGQQPRVNRARKSVSNFKIREGQAIGASVTLRGERMWEFLDRLIALAIPRIRDFRGMNPKGFDGRGNYSFGVTEQLIFPEIDYDKVMKVRGLDITMVTTAETDAQGEALLSAFGFPFRRQQVGA
ncbi:MAG: 50S ribosomal protein L5 [Actinomycetota bacterium]